MVSSDKLCFRLNRAVFATVSPFLKQIIVEQDDKNEAEETVIITEIPSRQLQYILVSEEKRMSNASCMTMKVLTLSISQGFFLNGCLPKTIDVELESGFVSLGVDLTKINLQVKKPSYGALF